MYTHRLPPQSPPLGVPRLSPSQHCAPLPQIRLWRPLAPIPPPSPETPPLPCSPKPVWSFCPGSGAWASRLAPQGRRQPHCWAPRGAEVTDASHLTSAHIREPQGVSSYHHPEALFQKPQGNDEEMEGDDWGGERWRPTHWPVFITEGMEHALQRCGHGERHPKGVGGETEDPPENYPEEMPCQHVLLLVEWWFSLQMPQQDPKWQEQGCLSYS